MKSEFLLVRSILFIAVTVVVAGCGKTKKFGDYEIIPAIKRSPLKNEVIPDPMREFRAAWVATVNNIDWPSGPNLAVGDQKREALAILDRAAELNLNAIIFQARPQADAFYVSEHEPWSYFLTGEQGKAPNPLWDPLAFWVKESHKRGLQLHAWLNPFRANHKAHPGPISEQSIIKTQPELVAKLGNEGYYWMDPSLKGARDHTLKVVLDVVNRYDIDAVHFDDYFYPYPSYNNNQDFPDDENFELYREAGGELDRAAWRRQSVNLFVQELSGQVRRTKQHVAFGISPFGIYRPDQPKGVSGMDQYNVLFADVKLWSNEGWVDYMMPQLYWPIGQQGQDFKVLLKWWHEQNTESKHMWPGLLVAKPSIANEPQEIVDQIAYTREILGDGSGMCLFSMKWLMNADYKVAEALRSGPWAEPALIPRSPWLNRWAPRKPSLDLMRNSKGVQLVRFKPHNESDVFQFVLNERIGDGEWQKPSVISAVYRSVPVNEGVTAIAVRSVDRSRNLSDPVIIEISE